MQLKSFCSSKLGKLQALCGQMGKLGDLCGRFGGYRDLFVKVGRFVCEGKKICIVSWKDTEICGVIQEVKIII